MHICAFFSHKLRLYQVRGPRSQGQILLSGAQKDSSELENEPDEQAQKGLSVWWG